MKTLIPTSAKALTLTLTMFLFASGISFAGGNHDKKTEDDAITTTYSESITEMAIALEEAEAIDESFEMASQVKIYDSNFNLIKESTVPSECSSDDKELLMLMRNSNLLMEYGNVTYYLMNQ